MCSVVLRGRSHSELYRHLGKAHYKDELHILLNPVDGWCVLCGKKPSHFAAHTGSKHSLVEIFLSPARHVAGGSATRKREAVKGAAELERWRSLVEEQEKKNLEN